MRSFTEGTILIRELQLLWQDTNKSCCRNQPVLWSCDVQKTIVHHILNVWLQVCTQF
eukprot:SAG31_NODE_2546_length_5531_cov_1.748159_5_plen_57_part_00